MKTKNDNHSFLADLLDDLNHQDLTSLLNYLAINGLKATRANIKGWRKKENAMSKYSFITFITVEAPSQDEAAKTLETFCKIKNQSGCSLNNNKLSFHCRVKKAYKNPVKE